jgi:hypothetical protein
MTRTSIARLFTDRGIAKITVGFLLATLSIPLHGEDSSPQPSANETLAAATPASHASTASGAAGEVSAGNPAGGAAAPAPSLEQVVELLRAQGQEIESLRAALRDQQEVTARLEAKLNAAEPAIGQPAGPAPTVADLASSAVSPLVSSSVSSTPAALPGVSAQADLAQKVAQLENSMANSQRDLESRLKNLGPFAFSGDFRLRAEPTFGGPVDQSQDQFRERFRLRFNAEARLNDQINGGFSFASGDLNNPISTNQTAGQYTTRKPIEIDRMYTTYHPDWFPNLTLTGGKFAYPWFNTELVWDKDINPEGAGETLAFNVETPVLKKFSFVGFQLPISESKRAAATDKSVYSTMVYGEQMQTFWQLGNRVRLSAYSGFYDWKNADSVALSVTVANSASPDDGLLTLNSNGLQNSIATVTTTNAITGAKTITSAQFASKFGIVDSLAQLDFVTPSERWPLTVLGDFAENTRACENVRNILAGAVYSVACDPHARHGYWLEATVGRTLKKGDWQFGYTRFMVQREAVIGAFNYSEIFPSTNVEMHRPEILYQLFDNITLQLNGLFGRPLVNAGSPAPVQPLWERFQFDMTYKF